MVAKFPHLFICKKTATEFENKWGFLSPFSGGFALWLDADLYHGASFSSSTFHNATLSTHEDFIVQDAEVWTVQNWLKNSYPAKKLLFMELFNFKISGKMWGRDTTFV